MILTGTLAVVASVLMWLLAPVLLPLINPDPSSAEVARFFRLLVWIFPVMTVNALLIIGLIAADDQRFLAISMAFVTLANLGLNVALTYPFGLYGLAVVIFITEGLILAVAGARFWMKQAAGNDGTASKHLRS
jgi:O-antigen/teichoic acid export membrane protein